MLWTNAWPATTTLAAVPLEPAHRSQPRLQPAVIAFDVVVGALLRAVPHGQKHLVQHDGVGRRLVRDDLHARHLGRAVACWKNRRSASRRDAGDERVDDLAKLVDGAVDVAPPARLLTPWPLRMTGRQAATTAATWRALRQG